ncbi:MAG: helix-turn-helix transcriptional regulator [Planctomycetota bacterium]|jgi:predicted DNA-binding transcriptional regulator AlpA
MKFSDHNDRPATAGQEAAPVVNAALISIRDIATLLDCSTRHVYRLVDTQRIPQPIKLGAMLRWIKTDIEHWIASGCPHCKKGV